MSDPDTSDPPSYPECNATFNGYEYYTSVGSTISSGVQMLMNFISSSSSCCIFMIFTIIMLVNRNPEEETFFTPANIIMIIIAVCCLSSCFGNGISGLLDYMAIKNETTKGRPCFSKKMGTVLMES